MKVDKDMYAEGSQDFYNPKFRYTLEAHLPFFRKHPETYSLQVNPNDSIVYGQDLFGFLSSRKIPPHLHWLSMRINDMFSPYAFNSEYYSILVPDTTVAERLRQSWKATTTISS